jgi:hypothetical protein
MRWRTIVMTVGGGDLFRLPVFLAMWTVVLTLQMRSGFAFSEALIVRAAYLL